MTPSTSGWRRTSILAVAILTFGVSLPASAEAGNRPPLGLYTCLYPPFFTPHPLKLVSRQKYKVDNSKKSPYAYKRGKVNFKRGAYSDFYGRYERANKQIVIYDKETKARLWNCPKGRL